MKHTSFHLVIGIVLIVTGALIIVTLSSSFHQAQLSNLANFPANVQINGAPPRWDGFDMWHDQAGSLTYVPWGDTVPGIVNGFVNLILNVNVYDRNGYDDETINMGARLIRTFGGGMYVNHDGTADMFDAFANINVGVDATYIYPEDEPVVCEPTGIFHHINGGVNNEQTFRCVLQFASSFDPTAPDTYYSYPSNYQAEKWYIITQGWDGENNFDLYEIAAVEYEEIIGLSVDSLIEFPPAVVAGGETELVNVNVDNRGNRNIWLAVETDKQTDADAWSCVGGYPLVSDVHYAWRWDNLNYIQMNPLNLNLASTGYVLDSDTIAGTHPSIAPVWNVSMRFSTQQAVAPGVCTLSNIVFTATPTS